MLMMEELIEIVKQTYPTLPALPGNFREKRALLEAVNVRLAEAGRTAVDEPTLNEAVLAIAPGPASRTNTTVVTVRRSPRCG